MIRLVHALDLELASPFVKGSWIDIPYVGLAVLGDAIALVDSGGVSARGVGGHGGRDEEGGDEGLEDLHFSRVGDWLCG